MKGSEILDNPRSTSVTDENTNAVMFNDGSLYFSLR